MYSTATIRDLLVSSAVTVYLLKETEMVQHIGALLLVTVTSCIIGVYLSSSSLMKAVWIQLKNIIHEFILAHLPSAISPASTDEVEYLNRRMEKLTLKLEGSSQDYNLTCTLLTPFFKTESRVKSKLIKEPVALPKPTLKSKKSVLSTRPPWR